MAKAFYHKYTTLMVCEHIDSFFAKTDISTNDMLQFLVMISKSNVQSLP